MVIKNVHVYLTRIFINKQYPWWSRHQKFYRHLRQNLIVGIFISMILHFVHDFSPIRQAEDAAFDWVMAMQIGIAPDNSPQKFAFLDIDEAAYKNWGEPLHIPRNKLLDIIQYAVRGKPALIVVDVDLSRWGQCLDHDLALINYLNAYQDRPPIVLPQLFKEPIEGEPRRTLRKSFFGDDSPNADARVFLASPLFELDGNDFRLRRWRLWEFTNDQKNIPSVEMSAVALIKSNRDPVDILNEVKEDLNTLAQGDAGKINIRGFGELETDHEDIGQRILYSIPGILQEGESYPENFVRRSVLPITKINSPTVEQKIVDQCPEQCPTECPLQCRIPSNVTTDMSQFDSSWLKGRVVVIGASFADSRDIYSTPIGLMPGAMVIVNAINSLYKHGQIEKPEIFWIYLSEILLIVLMSIAFALFDASFLGMLVSSSIIIAIMLPLSFYLFKYGIWLDFAIPLIGVQLHRMHASFEEIKKALIQGSSEQDPHIRKEN